jgi:hypothetical protein
MARLIRLREPCGEGNGYGSRSRIITGLGIDCRDCDEGADVGQELHVKEHGEDTGSSRKEVLSSLNCCRIAQRKNRRIAIRKKAMYILRMSYLWAGSLSEGNHR